MADSNNSQRYTEIGNEIKQTVIDAIESGDFTGLSSGISKSINDVLGTVLGDVGDQINKAAGNISSTARADAAATARRYHEEQEARIRRNKELRAAAAKRLKTMNLIKFKEIGSVSGVINILLGGAAISFALIGLAGMALTGVELDVITVGLIILALGMISMVKGVGKINLLDKARRFKKCCGDKFYVSVDDIAASMGVDRRKVVKDIRKVLGKGFFPEGYLDEEETTFMASRAVYDQYLETKHQRQRELLERASANKEESSELNRDQTSELGIMMAEGERAVARLHELNDEIPGEVISAKLDTTEKLLGEIFARVKDHPEQMKNCHKLMDYYMPTMLKLVEAYAEYDKVSAPGEDILKAKDEIEKTIDTINEAFSGLLNKLFRDSVWDVTADARVLQSMLGQDGLAKDEYEYESAPTAAQTEEVSTITG